MSWQGTVAGDDFRRSSKRKRSNVCWTDVAAELGLSTGQLSTWRIEELAAGSAEALAQRKAEEAEMQRLKRENRRLEEENQILRKAAAFFAKGIA
jgi:transposase